NLIFRHWADPAAEPIGRPFLAALGARVAAVESPGPIDPAHPNETNWDTSPTASRLLDPLATAHSGIPTLPRLHCPGTPAHPYLPADVRPVPGPGGAVNRIIALVRDVTAEVVQQQKLDALHQAGRDLAGLDAEQLAEMNIPSRVEMLKLNLRRCIHDLLHY